MATCKVKGLAVLVAAVGISGPAMAATISYGIPTPITGDSNVSVVRSAASVAGYEFGGNSHGAQTVNGVLFNPTDRGGDPNTSSIGLVGGLAEGTNGSVFTYGGHPDSHVQTLSTAFNDVLDGGNFSTQNDGGYIYLNNLQINQAYQVQLFVDDSRGIPQPSGTIGRTESVDSAVTLIYNVPEIQGGAGEYVIGTFTADSAQQQIFLLGNAVTQINALTLQAVPEPSSTWALVAMLAGGLTLARYRRDPAM